MDYEKKYKEAFELMKDCIPDENGLVHVRPCEIFTELADSEDEKIRKALVDYFTAYKEQKECGIKTFYGIPTDSIIAWLEKQGEKKPWSEDDEYYFNAIISVIKKNQSLLRLEDWDINWFESIKDRVQTQPQQEWSEEDIVAINSAVEVLSKDLPSLAASIRRLKQLSPQYSWKPSKEQMEALKAATFCQDKAMSKVLFELYQDLEKEIRHEG